MVVAQIALSLKGLSIKRMSSKGSCLGSNARFISWPNKFGKFLNHALTVLNMGNNGVSDGL